ncbi:MAG: ROK family transcriptional regulator [Lachnospiraceae bacterium]|nr:ROK family transcriptional regulator [Lachnospiraceae bacterium]
MKTLEPTATERRRKTRNRVFRYIYNSDEPVSKQAMSLDLNLSLPTIHHNVAELLEAGLIRAGETQSSTGGRPPVGYLVENDVRFSIGISITTNHIHFLASDLKMNQLAEKSVRKDSAAALDLGNEVRKELTLFIEENDLNKNRILGVGITIPGVLNRPGDAVLLSPSMKLKNISLQSLRNACEPYTVYIENDGNCAGYAEWLAMSPRERKNGFVYILLENGVGGAFFINGKTYSGMNHRSGEFGHMCVQPDGLMCNCGKRGCLEAYCSALRFSVDIGKTIEEFFDLVHKGDPASQALWDDVLRHLAIGIGNIRMIFDCDIVLGGFVSEYLKEYMPELKKYVVEMNSFGDDTDFVKLGKFPRKAGLMGIAWHFANDYIEKI